MSENLIYLLYEAMNTPLGIEVDSTSADRLRQKLYPLRTANPLFAPLSFVIKPHTPTVLWILRKGDPPHEGATE